MKLLMYTLKLKCSRGFYFYFLQNKSFFILVLMLKRVDQKLKKIFTICGWYYKMFEISYCLMYSLFSAVTFLFHFYEAPIH